MIGEEYERWLEYNSQAVLGGEGIDIGELLASPRVEMLVHDKDEGCNFVRF